jgi:hypothetical protein
VEMLKKSLEEIGGPSVRDSVMYYLRERYGVSFERVSENPSTLVDALTDIFGVGESLIESRVSEKLSESLELPEKPVTIVEAIKLAKKVEREKKATI